MKTSALSLRLFLFCTGLALTPLYGEAPIMTLGGDWTCNVSEMGPMRLLVAQRGEGVEKQEVQASWTDEPSMVQGMSYALTHFDDRMEEERRTIEKTNNYTRPAVWEEVVGSKLLHEGRVMIVRINKSVDSGAMPGETQPRPPEHRYRGLWAGPWDGGAGSITIINVASEGDLLKVLDDLLSR